MLRLLLGFRSRKRIFKMLLLWSVISCLLYGVFFTNVFTTNTNYKIAASVILSKNLRYWLDTDFHLKVEKRSEIIILWETTNWGMKGKEKVLTANKCPYLQPSSAEAPSQKLFYIACRLTHDRNYSRQSSALVFHSWDMKRHKFPESRSEDQIWIYLQRECPFYTKANLHNYSNVFNWTMTYRRDSDVYHPYGHVVPFAAGADSSVSDDPNATHLSDLELVRRPNLVAWIVSSCKSESKREDLVKELRNHVNVTVFGGCGDGEACPSKNGKGNCFPHAAKTHKFYLSFENGLCADYITEKLFDAMSAGMLPVVYGGADSKDYSEVAPAGSYIDARRFESSKQLAHYLLYLDQNSAEYLKYFEWRKEYKLVHSQGWCNLCQKVFEHLQRAPAERKKNYKVYTDLWAWWNLMSYKNTSQSEVPVCKPPITKLAGSVNNV